MPDAVKNLVMHIELPTIGGHVLMGTRLFQGLSAGGEVKMPLQDMFWGDFYGELKDRFGVRWMVNVAASNRG